MLPESAICIGYSLREAPEDPLGPGTAGWDGVPE